MPTRNTNDSIAPCNVFADRPLVQNQYRSFSIRFQSFDSSWQTLVTRHPT